MATCKECLHFEACSTIYEKAFREKPEKYTFLSACPLFKAKANYEEVKHGRWVYEKTHQGMKYVCSECSEIPECFEPNYCPNCGARMDLEGKK